MPGVSINVTSPNSMANGAIRLKARSVRIPTKPDGDSDFEVGHHSDLKPDTIPI